MPNYRVFRMVDGVRVEGTSRHIFLHDDYADSYYLTDLLVFADGVIDCGKQTDLAGLREQLESGRVATSFTEGSWASGHYLARWKFAEAESFLDQEMLLGEVADEIDRLNDRPDSIGRCRQSVHEFMDDRSESKRAVLRERYLAIPRHLRRYALGDMDLKDWPLRVLSTPVGARTPDLQEKPVTAEMHALALQYFEESRGTEVKYHEQVAADGPSIPETPTVWVPHTFYRGIWPADPGFGVLQLDYPAVIEVGDSRFRSVENAYWALSTTDFSISAEIAAASSSFEVRRLAETAPRQTGWAAARQAVMAGLLRAKFRQHPELAELLLSTGDGRIVCSYYESRYWSAAGSNWIGRLHEVVRSELAAERAGIEI